MARKRERTHEFIIRVTFDRGTTAATALAEVKDNIHGLFYTNGLHEDGEAETFKVRSFKPAPTNRKA
jgi:hypothetical protein